MEAHMTTRVRVNLANARELLELPGITPTEVEIIMRHRAEHGPIGDADQLERLLSRHPISDTLKEHSDFSPSDSTAPEAPGA
jgi:hypothetical protein